MVSAYARVSQDAGMRNMNDMNSQSNMNERGFFEARYLSMDDHPLESLHYTDGRESSLSM
jgi:hypothetical protein